MLVLIERETPFVGGDTITQAVENIVLTNLGK